MRTAHIIVSDSKGGKLISIGIYTDTLDKWKALEPKPGESVALWSAGYHPKIKTNDAKPAPIAAKKD